MRSVPVSAHSVRATLEEPDLFHLELVPGRWPRTGTGVRAWPFLGRAGVQCGEEVANSSNRIRFSFSHRGLNGVIRCDWASEEWSSMHR